MRTTSPTSCAAPSEDEPIRNLTLALDALAGHREANDSAHIDLPAAATLAGLAGVDAVRLGISDELKPVRAADVASVGRQAGHLELRMPVSQGLVKIALEARPERVLLAAGPREGSVTGGPLDLRTPGASLTAMVRALDEAGIPVALRIPPRLDAVKAAKQIDGVMGIELFTGSLVDLPARDREAELESLRDSVRLASKLHLSVGIGGRLDYRDVAPVLEGSAAVERVAVGRAVIARALLVGLDRALRDWLALIR